MTRKLILGNAGWMLVLAALIVTACGKGSSEQASAPAPVATPTAEELMKKSGDAMLATKTAKFGLKRLGKPAIFNEAMKLTFTEATCEYLAPDRAHATIKVGLANGNQMQIERTWVPEGIFQTNPLTKQYSKAPADVTFSVAALFKPDGIPMVLTTGFLNPVVIGNEKIDDEPAVHFKGECVGKIVAPLLADMIPNDRNYPVDVYTDPKTFYPKRVVLTVEGEDAFQIDLFGVDKPLEIAAPVLAPAHAAAPAPGAAPAAAGGEQPK